MSLFIVYTGTATSEEEPSHLLIRAETADAAVAVAADSDQWGFGPNDDLYVYEIITDGPVGVVSEFRRPV